MPINIVFNMSYSTSFESNDSNTSKATGPAIDPPKRQNIRRVQVTHENYQFPPTLGTKVPTHEKLETVIIKDYYYKQSPAYAIKNAGYTPLQLIKSLVIPHSKNNIAQRIYRKWNERLYVVYNDYWDKLTLGAVALSLILTIIILFVGFKLDATQIYQFKNSNDVNDQSKQKKLDKWNYIITSWWWSVLKVTAGMVPGIVSLWCIFKRTTHPKISVKGRQDATKNLKTVESQ